MTEVLSCVLGHLFNVKSSWQSTAQQGLQDAGGQQKKKAGRM